MSKLISTAIGMCRFTVLVCVAGIPAYGMAQESEYRDQVAQREEARERQSDSYPSELDQPALDIQRDGPIRQGGRRGRIELGATLQGERDALVVSRIFEESVAGRAGLRENDVIVSVAGRAVRTPEQFDRVMDSMEDRRDRVPIVILRDDRQRTVYLNFAPARDGDDGRLPPPPPDAYEEGAWLGVLLNPQYEDYAVVRRVQPGSPADEAQIREGDWILAVDGRRVRSPAHLSQLIAGMTPGRPIDIEVARRVTRTLSATLGELQDQTARGQRITRRPVLERVEQALRNEIVGPFEEEQPPVVRDRFGPEERGIRDRIDRDLNRDRLLERDNENEEDD